MDGWLPMNEIITLVNDKTLNKREVFASLRSIGMNEFYQAATTDHQPELKFVIADHLDYEGETLVVHDGQAYRVVRMYRTGQALELTVERVSTEEAELCG